MNKSVALFALVVSCLMIICAHAQTETATNMGNSLLQRLPSDLSMPHMSMPHINMPDMSMPDINMPDINMPDVSMPNMSMPSLSMPSFSSMRSDVESAPSRLSDAIIRAIRKWALRAITPDMPDVPDIDAIDVPKPPKVHF